MKHRTAKREDNDSGRYTIGSQLGRIKLLHFTYASRIRDYSYYTLTRVIKSKLYRNTITTAIHTKSHIDYNQKHVSIIITITFFTTDSLLSL